MCDVQINACWGHKEEAKAEAKQKQSTIKEH